MCDLASKCGISVKRRQQHNRRSKVPPVAGFELNSVSMPKLCSTLCRARPDIGGQPAKLLWRHEFTREEGKPLEPEVTYHVTTQRNTVEKRTLMTMTTTTVAIIVVCFEQTRCLNTACVNTAIVAPVR